MSNAEPTHSRLEAVPDRERERHPRADPNHEKRTSDPAHAGKSDTARPART